MREETARTLHEAEVREEVDMIVDSGASGTVMGADMVKAVDAKGARPDVKYEVADGSQINHLGEKTFTAFTDGGSEHYMTAQVTEVNKALLSVSRLASKGCRVVFDEGESLIDNKGTGNWRPWGERNGVDCLKMWISKDQQRPF